MRMVVVGCVEHQREGRVHERHLRQRAARGIGKKVRERVRVFNGVDGEERQKRDVAVVILAADAGLGAVIEDRGIGTQIHAVVQAVGLAAKLENAVRERGTEDRREVHVASGEVTGELRQELVIGFPIVADAIDVRRGSPHETVHQAVIHLDARAIVAVVGIVVTTARPIRSELVRRMADAARVHIGQAGLYTVGVRQPAQEMIEAAVLHHQDHDVFDLRCGRATCRQSARRRPPARRWFSGMFCDPYTFDCPPRRCYAKSEAAEPAESRLRAELPALLYTRTVKAVSVRVTGRYSVSRSTGSRPALRINCNSSPRRSPWLVVAPASW